jgi:ATP synthase protein I
MSEEPPDALKRLGEQIDKARAEFAPRQPAAVDRSGLQSGLGLGFRIGIELVVAIALAIALGWAIDRRLGTKPGGLIVVFLFGAPAGMLNVYRAVAGINAPVGYRRPGETAPSSQPAQAQDDWDDDED